MFEVRFVKSLFKAFIEFQNQVSLEPSCVTLLCNWYSPFGKSTIDFFKWAPDKEMYQI